MPSETHPLECYLLQCLPSFPTVVLFSHFPKEINYMEMLVSESVFRRTKAFDGRSRVGSDFPTLRQKGSGTNVSPVRTLPQLAENMGGASPVVNHITKTFIDK